MQGNEAWEALSIRTPTEDGDGDGCASDEDSQCSWETDCHSDSGSESYAGDENFDIDKYYDYGDLNETGGRYKVQLDDGTEVSLGEHEESCDCECGEERLCDCSPSGCGEGSIDMNTSDEDTWAFLIWYRCSSWAWRLVRKELFFVLDLVHESKLPLYLIETWITMFEIKLHILSDLTVIADIEINLLQPIVPDQVAIESRAFELTGGPS
jgi:hypothetical protein